MPGWNIFCGCEYFCFCALYGAILSTSTTGEIMETVDQLKEAWNTEADQFNQWSDLGADEMIEFAQNRMKSTGEEKLKLVLSASVALVCSSTWQGKSVEEIEL